MDDRRPRPDAPAAAIEREWLATNGPGFRTRPDGPAPRSTRYCRHVNDVQPRISVNAPTHRVITELIAPITARNGSPPIQAA